MRHLLFVLYGVFLVVGYHVVDVDAMQCYLCNSHNDSRCAEKNPPDALKVDCSDLMDGAKYTMCRKITQVIEFSVNGLSPNTRVIRGCGWVESSYKGQCYQRSGFGGRQEVCSCLTDFCNGATPSISFTPMSLLIPCVLGMLLAYTRH